jgi:glycosyltransferase involved in cell wall biosynthesis
MLSITIIAKNASSTIRQCITSVLTLANDIVVVVDSESTDETLVIAASLGCKTHVRKLQNFADQKNYAASLTANDWILSLDADETVSDGLKSEIQTTLKNPEFFAYSIPRTNIIFGKVISHTNWSPEDDRHVWLFNKHHFRWSGLVHEHVVGTSPVGKLTHPKIHANYTNVSQFLSKLNLYTSFESQLREYRPILFIIYPFWKFIRHFIIKMGFLDGWHGFYLSYLQALYGLVVVVKTWEKRFG